MYSTLAYVKVGRKERQPRQTNNTHKAMNIQYMHMYTSNKVRDIKKLLEDTRMPSLGWWVKESFMASQLFQVSSD